MKPDERPEDAMSSCIPDAFSATIRPQLTDTTGLSSGAEHFSSDFAKPAPGSTTEENLVRQYEPIVKSILAAISQTLPPHVSVEDLYCVGLVGLLKAIRGFDSSLGAPFTAYLNIRVRGAMFDELRHMNWAPRSVVQKSRQIQSAMEAFEQANGRTPSDEEMAAALDIPLREYMNLAADSDRAHLVSLEDTVLSEDSESTNFEAQQPAFLTADDNPSIEAAKRDLVELISIGMLELPTMDRKVLALYYFEDLRLHEIATAFNLTESRISQIHKRAIASIRSWIRIRDLSACC